MKENYIRKYIKKVRSMNLDRKLSLLFTCIMFGMSILMFAIFTSIYVTSFISQSKNLARNQLSVLANNYKNTFDNYKEMAVAIIIDDNIQSYVKYDGEKNVNYYGLMTNASSTLQNMLNTNNQISFIAIISSDSKDFIYKGIPNIAAGFMEAFNNDYKSNLTSVTGNMRMSFNQDYLKNKFTLNVYHPIYSVTNIKNEIGTLCIIFKGSIIESLSDKSIADYDSNLFMVDCSNNSCLIMDGNQTEFEYSDYLRNDNGSFRIGTDLYIYQKVGTWNYYLISKISLINMHKSTNIVLITLSLIIVTITYLGLIISRQIVKKNYHPLENIISKMKHVGEGRLDVRINMEKMGDDYVKLADGFNYMMDQINTLMEQVKTEQQQMNQIRFNALQSQIQPHFLYNTLDCIHWQAIAEGNNEISVLVKALAQYYRLCLSNGKDVIRLEQELEHVKNYLIIQNMRFDNIIKYEISIDENCKNVYIPKITIQPLVENSIYHGIKIKEGKRGFIKITGKKIENDVYITVEDNGTGMTKEQIDEMNQSISQYDKDFGYGVRNVNKRIEILFGKEYGLYYEKNQSGGVTVTIHLPSLYKPEYEEVL